MISGRAWATRADARQARIYSRFPHDLNVAEFKDQVGRLGLAFIGQTPEVAPADGKLYSLRDATATVEIDSADIASSIMSRRWRWAWTTGARRKSRRGRVHEEAGGRAAAWPR